MPNTTKPTVRPSLKPGYAFEWEGTEPVMPRTQQWDISVILADECDSAQYRGSRSIDGSTCDIFYAGEVRGHQRYFAQCQTMTR